MAKVSDFKVNDVFYMEGLTHRGNEVNLPVKLIAYLGNNRYQIETDGLGMLVYGDDEVTTKQDNKFNDPTGLYFQ